MDSNRFWLEALPFPANTPGIPPRIAIPGNAETVSILPEGLDVFPRPSLDLLPDRGHETSQVANVFTWFTSFHNIGFQFLVNRPSMTGFTTRLMDPSYRFVTGR